MQALGWRGAGESPAPLPATRGGLFTPARCGFVDNGLMTASRRNALAQMLALLSAPFAARVAGAATHPLVIDFMVSSGQQRTAWAVLINTFAALNPDLSVVANEFQQEDYKRQFAARLGAEPVDLAFWFAGARLREAVGKGLLRPIDDRDTQQVLGLRFATASLDALEYGGKLYGVPVSYYPWGFFYHRPVCVRQVVQKG